MVKNNFKRTSRYIDFIYFYNLMLTKNWFIFYKSYYFFKKFNKIYNILLFFNIKDLNSTTPFNKKFLMTLKKKHLIDFTFKKRDEVEEIPNITPAITFLKKKDFFFKIFNIFFMFNYTLYNTKFKPHYSFKLFFIVDLKNTIIAMNFNKFLSKWKDSLTFLYNIFYYNFNSLIFGTHYFKNEILALNWNISYFEMAQWKFFYPFFFLKTNRHGVKLDFFLKKISYMDFNFLFISDLHYHEKNLSYLNKHYFFTIALIGINQDPTLASYSLPVYALNHLSQFFFFKLLISFQNLAFYNQYKNYLLYWKNLNLRFKFK